MVPLRPDPDDPSGSWLTTDDGFPLATTRIRHDDGTRIAADVRPLPGVPLPDLAIHARRDLAGLRLDTADDRLVQALVATGLVLTRAATEMRHRLHDVPPRRPLAEGWSLTSAGWDDDLEDALAAAYGPGHPDGRWTPENTVEVRGMYEPCAAVPALRPASARLRGPDGRSAGHVLCAGPVPWTDDECVWVLNLGVAPYAQRRGFGRALIIHTLHGARHAGLPSVGLEVVDGGPGRKLYDEAGFVTVARILSVPLPADPLDPGTNGRMVGER